MFPLLATGFPIFVIPNLGTIESRTGLILFAIPGAFLYFLPSIIGWYRRLLYLPILFILNLILGWSLIAWFATLLFAIYGRTEAAARAKSLAARRKAEAEYQTISGVVLSHPTSTDSGAERAAAQRDPRGTVAILVGGAVVLSFVWGSSLRNLWNHQSGPTIRLAAAKIEGPDASAPDELTSRATFQDIINQCGQPEREWTTSIGQGSSLQIVDHLFYSRVPAEIRLSIRPNEGREQSRHWTFAGASAAPDSTSTYSGEQLKQRMPCVAQWADAMASREARDLKGDVH